MALGFTDLESLWLVAGGRPGTQATAAAVALAESGGNPAAILNTAYPKLPGYHPPATGNLPEYSVGLWQINVVAHPSYSVASLLTPTGNANAAVSVSNLGLDFRPWSTYTSGAYKTYLAGVPAPTPQPGAGAVAPSGPETARAFRGWNDLQNAMNRHLTRQLRTSRSTGRVTLRTLARKHRVGR